MDLIMVPTMSSVVTGVPRLQTRRVCLSDGGIKYTIVAAPSTEAVSLCLIVPLLS